MRRISLLDFFNKIIAAQMDGKVGVPFPLRVVHLMCDNLKGLH